MESVLNPEEKEDVRTNAAPVSRKKAKVPLTFIYFLLLILILGGTIYGIKSKPEILGLSKPSGIQEDVQGVVAEVSKIIQLPAGEIPTLATVTDLSKVQDQSFFTNAKEGDRVLVYQSAKKAYLYRPSEKKIIEVGVVNVSENKSDVAGENTEISVTTPTQLPTEIPASTSPISNSVTNSPSPTIVGEEN